MTARRTPGSSKNRTSTHLKDGKKRTPSSRRWLLRQLNDPYVRSAQEKGYRSRAAFKLLQLDEKFNFLKKNQRIVDLGCAPGGWLQVALERTQKRSSPAASSASLPTRILGVDLQAVDPLPGVTLLQGDFLEDSVVSLIHAHLEGPADVVMSDMAASSSGHPATDHLKIMALLEAALDFAERVLAPGGCFIAKVLQGGSEKDILQRLKTLFAHVDHAKPDASRKDSAEMYVVARGFRSTTPPLPPLQ